MTIPSPPTDAALLGLDNVRLDLPIAGIGSRTLAALFDYLLLVVVLTLWWLGGFLLLRLFDLGAGWGMALLILGSFAVQWGYFAVLEIVMQGQTPGKGLLGLRVVSRHGGRPSVSALLVRNLLRSVDVIVGLPWMAWDRRARRLGDLAGGTLVVHDRPPLAGEELRLGRLPASWGAREIVVVESFLRRAGGMEPQRARAMAERLLAWIEREEPAFVAEAEAAQGGGDPVTVLSRLLAVEPPLHP